MKPIYTVFSLSSPDKPEDVRYIGLTSQSLPKRVGDLVSGSMNEVSSAYGTHLSEWLRTLQTRPLAIPRFESEHRSLAVLEYKTLVNRYLDSGRLLNTKPGRIGGQLRTEPMHEQDIPGRVVEDGSVNSLLQATRKQ